MKNISEIGGLKLFNDVIFEEKFAVEIHFTIITHQYQIILLKT